MGQISPSRRVCFITLGCAKNEVDTDRMRSIVGASPSMECVDDPDDADAIVVNTCSFLVSAVEEGLETVLSLVNERIGEGAEGSRRRPIVMTGCIPSRYGQADLAKELPEVAAFVPVDEEDSIAAVLACVMGEPVTVPLAPVAAPVVARTVQSPTAYVKISDGCDRYCSFCAIPYIRGRYYSRTREEILEEASYLVDNGVREIVLIGQDTGVWGHDLPGKPSLASLLRDVAGVMARVDGLVRVLYLQPEGLSDELVGVIRDVPQVAKYIDIPLQHSSADVLARMNRTGSRREFLDLVVRLRSEVPGITLRTTAMVGFPGETEEEFEDLVSFLEEAEFDYCATFSYSQEDGTAAAELPGQVPEEVKLERLQRVIDIAEACGFASASRRIGQRYRVLVDGREDDGDGGFEMIGRAAFQAPDSDGVVHLGSADVSIGDFVEVEIEDAACYELFGSVVEGTRTEGVGFEAGDGCDD